MIVVAATFKVKEGKKGEMEKGLKNLAELVRKNENGTLVYSIHKAIGDPTKFLVYEKYKDDEALNEHSGSSYFQEFMGNAMEWVDGMPEISMYEEI